jgi:ABC-type glutathione transport system ATPase component
VTDAAPLLSVRALGVRFPAAAVVAVEDVSFDIAPGEMVALVGGSGSGKSATALAILGLSDPEAVQAPEARITFDGVELTALDHAALRSLRGRRIAMIFQEPTAALNPSMSIVDQVAETVQVHGDSADARGRAETMLARVGLDATLGRAYPHELSGGQCQRAMIAMALVLRPALIIADEPTSSLDTLAQAQIIALLRDLQRETGMALLLVSHDLGVVASLCSRVLVMHDGRIVEAAPTARLLTEPVHPITVALLRAVPRLRGTE